MGKSYVKKLKINLFVIACLSLSLVACRKEEVPSGGINGKFSVSELRKVYFSKGNLQFQATTKTWRFAESQYEVIGDLNSHISETYDGWIDLFAWSSSGCISGAHICQPWSVSPTSSDYYPVGVYNNNLNHKTGSDWGCNAISNGGNQKNMWYTLSFEEWQYLLDDRENASKKKGFGTVAGIHGMILLPDEWNQPNGIPFDPNSSWFEENNVYSHEEWVLMESAGAVFLPAAGWREIYDVYETDRWGLYWTNSCYKTNQAYNLVFGHDIASIGHDFVRGTGLSVRLARDVDD